MIHARTKAHGYRPPAYWDRLAEVRQSLPPHLRLPVIANGEIWTVADAVRCREVTGCEHLMIGRGMVTDPGLALAIKGQRRCGLGGVASAAADLLFATLWKQIADALRHRGRVHPGRLAARRRSRPRSRRRLAEDKARTIKAVMVVHNETSTGSTSRIAEIRKAIDAAGHPALFMVDTISSLASVDYRHDEWGVDVTVSGSQKGLMLPPGLSFNAISEKAMAASKTNTLPRSYLGLAGDGEDQRQRLLPLHAGDEPALRAEGSARDAAGGGAGRRSSPAISAWPQPAAPPSRPGGSRCSARTRPSTRRC